MQDLGQRGLVKGSKQRRQLRAADLQRAAHRPLGALHVFGVQPPGHSKAQGLRRQDRNGHGAAFQVAVELGRGLEGARGAARQFFPVAGQRVVRARLQLPKHLHQEGQIRSPRLQFALVAGRVGAEVAGPRRAGEGRAKQPRRHFRQLQIAPFKIRRRLCAELKSALLQPGQLGRQRLDLSHLE